MTDGKVTDNGVSVQILIEALDQAAFEIAEAANVMRDRYPNLATVFDKAAQGHRDLVAKAAGQ